MIKLILLLFFLTTSSVFCQNRAYLKWINVAELNITDHNFALAFENYTKAFELSEEPKTIDLVNALKCTCLSKKTEADSLVIKLLRKGLTYEDLFVDKVLKKCIDQKQLEFNPSSIDFAYRTKINALDKADQLFRTKMGSYRKYRKQIDSLDKLIVAELVDLINTKGFPSEPKIGVENIFGYQGWEIVVRHHQQQRSKEKGKPDVFSALLMNALKNDEITPLKYATYVELQNDSTYLKYLTNPLVILKKGAYRIFKSTLQEKQQINAARKAIGMNPLADDIKKIIYQKENKYQFRFGIDGGYFDLTTQENSVKQLLKQKTMKLDLKVL